MTIRQATPKDFDAIYSLVKTAFQTAKVSDGGEQDFVLKLRKGSYIPELELVAEEDGVLIGHIMLTGASIRENSGCFGTLLLAPLSVALEWRAKGIGAALIREALAKAAALGHSSAVLIGDPGYYGRFGFHSAASISYPGVPGEYTLACELTPVRCATFQEPLPFPTAKPKGKTPCLNHTPALPCSVPCSSPPSPMRTIRTWAASPRNGNCSEPITRSAFRPSTIRTFRGWPVTSAKPNRRCFRLARACRRSVQLRHFVQPGRPYRNSRQAPQTGQRIP